MFFLKSDKNREKKDHIEPKPKEAKPGLSLLSKTVMIPGAIIAGILLFIATGFGIFRLFSFSRKKKEKAKQTNLDT
jgi:flagellar basal body-associated protein FliL